MNYKFSLKTLLLPALILTVCFASSAAAQPRRFRGGREFLRYTRNLPRIDKVEVLKLKLDGDLWRGEIESSKTLTGIEAQKIASIWRRQTYLSNGAICHNPAYGIKFYSGQELLADATVCWDCNNIRFWTPRLTGTQYFDGEGKRGQQLLQIFRRSFLTK